MFDISTLMLEEVLHLPKGCKIIGAQTGWEKPSTIRVWVRSPDFPKLRDGESVPVVKPEITLREIDGKKEYTWDWKLEPGVKT
jgi:hypothetical protein